MIFTESDSSSHPRLPPELEREILELATRTDPTNKFQYLLVCQRARAWIEPIIYETVIQINRPGKEFEKQDAVSLPAHRSRHVQNLVLAGIMSSRTALDILRKCPNLTNVALWTHISPEALTILSHTPLRRLSTNFRRLTGGNWDPIKIASLRNLTHVEFTDHCGSWDSIEWLTELPNLTHLAFDSDVPLAVMESVLTNLVGLMVLVSLTFHVGEGETMECKERARNGFRNRKVVYLSQSSYMHRLVVDWVGTARGGLDIWVVAENIIRKRIGDEWDSNSA
ncbi:hypothetical protein BDN72DRAFT_849987 [Pluteus cervinus]|uniref:Uncharacterized protein n=1 Tax=Pluteus cervinus TaxID=181527 RepID=A0ACD3A6N8_9AGAR|nr:hypothetical protein BDN72DRAFT_849987 [Pluteus cervinus]